MIPGLERAAFVRYGVMHRNTYINAPRVLNARYQMRAYPNLYFAGQITGVEGYVESAASGLLAGLYAAGALRGEEVPVYDATTAIGALAQYVSNESVTNFQPMNVNYGIMRPLDVRIRDKRQRAEAYAARSLAQF